MNAGTAGLGRLQLRLATFYFFYYATVGAFIPYWPPYLAARGFSASEIGIVFALMGIMRAVVPVAWGAWSDHTGQRMPLIRWAALLALTIFAAIPFVETVWWIGALMLAYTLFWHALLPQFEVVALNHLRQSGGDYSRVRLWGSVGFIAAVLVLGPALDWGGIEALPWFIGAFWIGMSASAWYVNDAPAAHDPDTPRSSLWSVLRRPEIIALLLACLASQWSYAAYNGFFTLLLEDYGYNRSQAGLLWSLGVLAEVGVFVVAGRLIDRFGLRPLLLLALGVTALRWATTAALTDHAAVLLVVQLSHAVSFGIYHVVAVNYVMRWFPADQHGRGQAIYNAVAYGIGGSIGSLASGYLWESVSPQSVFWMAAAVAGIGTWVAWKFMRGSETAER